MKTFIIKDIYLQGWEHIFGTKIDYAVPHTVYVKDGRIEALDGTIPNKREASIPVMQAKKGLSLLPGMLDRHIHGMAKADFSDESIKSIRTIVTELPQHGVTHCVATFVTMPMDKLKRCVKLIEEFKNSSKTNDDTAEIVGIHLEGPWISKLYCCAHDPDHIQEEADIKQATGRRVLMLAVPRHNQNSYHGFSEQARYFTHFHDIGQCTAILT